MEERYILVKWPECQKIEESDKKEECYLASEEYAYFVPESIYKDIYSNTSKF